MTRQTEDPAPDHAIFVASQQMTADERRRLASFMWGDSEPTIEAYAVVLAGLRMAKKPT